MIKTLKSQQEFYAQKNSEPFRPSRPEKIDKEKAAKWIHENTGIRGEEVLDLLGYYGIHTAVSKVATRVEEAIHAAGEIGYPLVAKVVSPDAVHKSEAGGVCVGIQNDEELKRAYNMIESNLYAYKKDATFQGVRVMQMAEPGYDMFVGGSIDKSFGPVVFFGYGGIYIEVFNDTEKILCPSNTREISAKLAKLKSYSILRGARGKKRSNIEAYTDLILRVSCLMADFPEITELDLNPVRVLEDGSTVLALDARARIK